MFQRTRSYNVCFPRRTTSCSRLPPEIWGISSRDTLFLFFTPFSRSLSPFFEFLSVIRFLSRALFCTIDIYTYRVLHRWNSSSSIIRQLTFGIPVDGWPFWCSPMDSPNSPSEFLHEILPSRRILSDYDREREREKESDGGGTKTERERVGGKRKREEARRASTWTSRRIYFSCGNTRARARMRETEREGRDGNSPDIGKAGPE